MVIFLNIWFLLVNTVTAIYNMVEKFWSLKIQPMSRFQANSTKKGTIINDIFGERIIVILLVTPEVVLAIGQSTSTPRNIILEEIGIMGMFRNIRISIQHPPWRYLGVRMIHLVLMMVLIFLNIPMIPISSKIIFRGVEVDCPIANTTSGVTSRITIVLAYC